jgi:hypothetical protein
MPGPNLPNSSYLNEVLDEIRRVELAGAWHDSKNRKEGQTIDLDEVPQFKKPWLLSRFFNLISYLFINFLAAIGAAGKNHDLKKREEV